MPPKGHAVESPSAAKRWIHCPPSALLNAEAPRKDSVYAREGTLAHEFCERKARFRFGLDKVEPDFSDLRAHELYKPEMERCSDIYVDFLSECASALGGKPYVAVEKHLSLEDKIEGCFGTADCVMLSNDVIQVCDYKHGMGVAVNAFENEQMMTYAVGALLTYGEISEFKRVRMSIIQPRVPDGISTWECGVDVLEWWAEHTLYPAARLAFKGEGRKSCGSWCKWCVSEGTCKAQVDFLDELLAKSMDGEIEVKHYGQVIDEYEQVQNWLKAIREKAMDAILRGEDVPGYMVAEGQSRRAFSDEKKAFDIARGLGIPDEMLYERKPVTLSQLETLVGKKKFAESMRDVVVKPKGSPQLVRADSGKKPYEKPSVYDDFFG